MPGPAHEQTINTALGEVLNGLRRSWTIRAEETGGVLDGGGRPDILVEDASSWPVVIEAERTNYTSAERDAIARLGRRVTHTGLPIETAIALVYPDALTYLDGKPLRDAIHRTSDLEYALYTHRNNAPPERLPNEGWIRGSVRDLAMLTHRATTPPSRVESLAIEFEHGVEQAANAFTRRHAHGSDLGADVARILGQDDDTDGQTRRMAMTVIVNALIFHEALAAAEFQVPDEAGGPVRSVYQVNRFRFGDAFIGEDLCREWDRILEVNYWPIFSSAKEMLRQMSVATGAAVLERLWDTAQRLVASGVTRSHDLTGIVFQRLIADRKFLATYYTRPEAAALLAGLALPAGRPLGGGDWGDGDTLAGAQVGDFACGTGTLLSAAYQRISLLHELHGGDPQALHAPMMKHGLVGLDVVNIAVHLTAAMLAGTHPDTPFDGECLLTMPYGNLYTRPNGNGNGNRKRKETITIGSLDLLADSVQASLIDTAAARTAGGRAPEDVIDLVSRIGHGKFDLVIMNPPFARPTNHEASHADVPIPAYAAFETTPAQQAAMSDRVRELTQDAPSNDNAGIASHFVELAHRKMRRDGTVALVLPLSALSGASWDAVRSRWRNEYADIAVVTIAGAGQYESSFSAETGMAECLLVASGRNGEEALSGAVHATFVVLNRFPGSANEAGLLADQITQLRLTHSTGAAETQSGQTHLRIGSSSYGTLWHASLPETGPWPLVGIADMDLAQFAHALSEGKLVQPGQPGVPAIDVSVVLMGNVAGRGPVHRDIDEDNYDGTPRGPFRRYQPPVTPVPMYPMLWAHDRRRERQLVVVPDAEGEIKVGMDARAVRIWTTATRAHYNSDLRFNSQSLIVAMTVRRCIGGRAWPSVVFTNPEHEYAFALWCNSTLGLLMHWWRSNKTQSGRGTITVTGIPNIPTLDTRVLTAEQHVAAKAAFDALRDRRFLPFDQVDEDPARAELDHRLLVDVLGLDASLCAQDGPIDLLRRKLAAEPQIHGGKKTRVAFGETVDDDGNVVLTERNERRSDR